MKSPKPALSILILSLCTSYANAQWIKTKGPSCFDPSSIAFQHGRLFAAYNNLFSTSDEGMHWSHVDLTGPDRPGFYSDPLALVASNGSRLFLAGRVQPGLWMSDDDGMNWRESGTVFRQTIFDYIGCAENVVIANSWNDGDFISNDRGNTWAPFVVDSLKYVIGVASVRGTIYVVTQHHVFTSLDSGATWHRIDGRLQKIQWGFQGIATLQDSLIILAYDAYFKTTDEGQTWIRQTILGEGPGFLDLGPRCVAALGHTMVAGCPGNGLFRSIDGGASWTVVDNGLPLSTSYTTLVAFGNTIFMICDAGFFSSRDTGLTWQDAGGNSGLSDVWRVVATDSAVIAGLDAGSGLFRTTDDGDSWARDTTGLNSGTIFSLAAMGNLVFASTNEETFRSDDEGVTWNSIHLGCNAMATCGTVVYAGGYGACGRSVDSGRTWTNSSKGLPPSVQIYAIAVAANDSTVIARSDYSISRSTDRGTTWSAIDIDNGSDINAIATVNNVFYAVVRTINGNLLFRSSDQGNSWTADSTWIGIYLEQLSMVQWKGSVILSTWGGCYTSSNNGITWTQFSSDLTYPQLLDIAIHHNSLFAGSFWNGVWKRELSTVNVDESRSFLQNSLSPTLNIYPNPFHASTTVHYTTDVAVHNTLSICDLLGNTIATVKNEVEAAGVHDVSIELPATISGALFLRLRSGSKEVITPIVQTR